jgi:hypothetical protein
MAEIDRRKASLIAELEISRSEMRSALAQCEESLDVVAQLRRNVRENKIAWLAGAVVLGYVASKVLGRTLGAASRSSTDAIDASDLSDNASATGSDRSRRSARVWDAASFVFDLAKPTLFAWASARLPDLLSRVASRAPQTSASVQSPGKRAQEQSD